MENLNFSKAHPFAKTKRLRGVSRQALVGEDPEGRGETSGTESESFVAGVIVDSWIENALPADAGARLVLQVAPRVRPPVVREQPAGLTLATTMIGGQ
jgi:hypothetical protein